MVSPDFGYVRNPSIKRKIFSINNKKIETITIKYGLNEIKTIIIVTKRSKTLTKIHLTKVITRQKHKLANESFIKIMSSQTIPIKITKINPFLTNKNPIKHSKSLQQLLFHLKIKH